MQKIKNLLLPTAHQKTITLVILSKYNTQAPTIIYAHGLNGFKNLGNFDLIAEQLLKRGFTYVQLNFPPNGTTPTQ